MTKTAKTHGSFASKSWREIGRPMSLTRKANDANLVSSKSGQWLKRRFREPKTGFSRKRLFCTPNYVDKGGYPLTRKIPFYRRLTQTPAAIDPSPGNVEQEVEFQDRAAKIKRIVYWSHVALAAAFILSLQPVFAADTIWDKFSAVMKDIYGKLLGISTIIAVTAATIALLVRMISRNQRAVDEASTWLKRIVVTWIILNTLGFIIAYLQPWFAGGQYTP